MINPVTYNTKVYTTYSTYQAVLTYYNTIRSLTLLIILIIIIKFLYNERPNWLKQRALSENSARVDDVKLVFKFLLRNFDKFDLNYDSDKCNTRELFVSI